MCGIAGVVRSLRVGRSTAAPPAADRLARLVERVSEAQRHRGPDGSGLWRSCAQEVVFGHRRLAILDLSTAAGQPMVDAESGCAITFNGEVYNFFEIRRDLEQLGETFHTSSDTEVVLKAYKRWGLAALPRFRGIFALALWDPRTRAVHLARDPLGIKPLYWTVVPDEDSGGEALLFASEVRAILASGAVARRLSPAAVASYLWHGFVVGPDTAIEGVHLLPAASILSLEADPEGGPNRRTLVPYWQMPRSAAGRTEMADLRRELQETIRMQLVADVPVGVFLSGGIDSSAVAALAAEVAPETVHTFTVGFEVAAYDESHHAQQVAQAVKSRHRRCLLTEQTFRQQLPEAFTAIDQPTFDGINTYFVSRAAREAGMTVALAGTGGDEVFGGYPSFVDVPRLARAGGWLPLGPPTGMVRRFLDHAATLGARLMSDLSWNVLGIAPPQTRWGKAIDVARVLHDTLGLYQVFYALFTRESQTLLAAEAVRKAQQRQDHGLSSDVAATWRRRVHGSDLRHAVSVLELSSFIGERLLRDTDAASMAVALEVRVPLLDHVLAETAAGLEPARRFSPPGRKQVLREAALSRLDPALFDRPKSGFVLPIDTWARQGLRKQMEDAFADDALARSAGLCGRTVRTLWRSFSEGRPGLYWSRVWALYVLLSWCRTHDVALAA
jgi:asparagine synthase (glutamine-hydrolysing)